MINFLRTFSGMTALFLNQPKTAKAEPTQAAVALVCLSDERIYQFESCSECPAVAISQEIAQVRSKRAVVYFRHSNFRQS